MMAICLSSSSGVTSELPEPEPMIARSTSATHQGYETARPASAESSHRSERQMKADSCIELRHEPARHGSDASTDSRSPRPLAPRELPLPTPPTPGRRKHIPPSDSMHAGDGVRDQLPQNVTPDHSPRHSG